MSVDLEAIKARLEKASAGPWRTGRSVYRTLYTGETLMGLLDRREDAEFAAATREDVPALVAELERARAVLKKVEWKGSVTGDGPCCPVCGAEPTLDSWPWSGPHEPDCELAALLGETK